MRGHVRTVTKGKKYRVYADAGTDPVTGKRRQVTKVVHGGRREADAALTRLLAEIGRGLDVGTDTTVAELAEMWLTHVATRVQPRTVAFYRTNVDRLPGWFTALPVWKVRSGDVDRVYDRLNGAKGERRVLGAATCQTTHRTLRAMFAQAVRWEWIERNPVANARPPRHDTPEMHPPSMADMRAAIDAADGNLGLWLRLAGTTGARVAELGGLRWGDVDLEARTLSIARQAVAVPGGGTTTKPRTKSGKPRTVTLDAGTCDVLRARRAQLADAGLDDALAPEAFVLATDPRRATTPPRPDYPAKAWAKLRDRVGLAGVRVHDWRHAVATQMLADGVDVRTVAGRLGHDPRVTLKVYAAWLPEVDRAAADRHGAHLDG